MLRKPGFFIFSLVALLGCEPTLKNPRTDVPGKGSSQTKQGETSGPNDSQKPSVELQCESLHEKDCIRNPLCSSILAREYKAQENASKPACLDESRFFGCAAKRECGEETQTVCDSAGRAFQVLKGCQLPSWSECEPPFPKEEIADECGPEKPKDYCEELDESQCKADSQCQILKGEPILSIAGEDCLDARVFIGCVLSRECEDSEFFFCTPDKLRFKTMNGCSPSSWFECDDPDGSLNKLPRCKTF